MSEELKLQRSREQWSGCDPRLMAQQSPAAIMYAIQDARLDIDALHRQADQLRAELSRIKADLTLALKVPSVAAMHTYLDTVCARQNVQFAAERDAALKQVEGLRALLSGVCDYADGLLIDVNRALDYGGSTGPELGHEDDDYRSARSLLQDQP